LNGVLSQRHGAGRRLLATLMAALSTAPTAPATNPVPTTEKENST
jgi:hypothetical protein